MIDELPLNPRLLKVPTYVAGKSAAEVQEELGLERVTKLGSNENPLGPSPKALAALTEWAGEAHRYPGIAERELRRRLAAHHGPDFTAEHFIIGNGGTDVLRMVAQAFIFDGGASIMGSVTFPLYTLLTTMYGGESVKLDLRDDDGLDLEAMAKAANFETRVIWLCSPNNPTGLVLRQNEVDDFMNQLPPHVVVVFDESYCDFVTDPSAVDSTLYIGQKRAVVIVRSFSKSSGLANLRVGYGMGQPALMEYLLHTVLPFNTGALAARAAMASLDDHEYRAKSRVLIAQERDFLFSRISAMGLDCAPSQSNFILINNVPGGGQAFSRQLVEMGVVVRPMAAFGRPAAVRVTVGLRPENERLLAALEQVLNKAYDEAI